jgi:hypothetical protein
MTKTKTVLPLLAAGLYFALSFFAPRAARAAPAAKAETACLVEAAWTEARGLPPRDADAVMWVLVNRSRAPGWPRTVCGVYRQPGQFEGRGGFPRPRNAAGRASLAEIEAEASRVASGAAPDPTGGALYFYCPAQRAGMGYPAPPSFATASGWRARIGPLEFYGARRHHHRKETRNAGRERRAEAAGPREDAGRHAVQDGGARHH